MSKYRMYIDESGNSDLVNSAYENNRYLCLTGVIFDLEYVNNCFSKEFEDFKTKYFGYNADNPVILHRKDIMNYRGRFSVLKDERIKQQYNNELFSLLSHWEFTIISIVLDKKEIIDLYGNFARHPYYFCMEVLLEKYIKFLKDKKSIGDVLIESRNKQDDRKLSQVYREMCKDGTRYIDGETLRNYLSSMEIKIKPKSSNIAGLQIADLLVTNMRNRILEKYNLREISPNCFGTKLTNLLIPKIFKHNKKYWGYGLKKLP